MSMERLLDNLNQLPPWPTHLHELLTGLNSDDLEAGQLAEKIGHEHAVLIRLLRVANSPFYGVSRQISNPLQAINIIGLRNTRSIVTAAIMLSRMPQAHGGFDFKEFWKDAVGTAYAAQWLAGEAGLSRDELFTAGILHDVGQIVMCQDQPIEYQELVFNSKGDEALQVPEEQKAFGFDHAEVGAAIATKWNFPASLANAIRWHHAPEQSSDLPAWVLWAASHVAQFANGVVSDPQTIQAHLKTVQAKLGIGAINEEQMADIARRGVATLGVMNSSN